MLDPPVVARALDQDAAHRERGGGANVSAAVPAASVIVAGDAQIRLVDEGGRLERLVRLPLAGEPRPREFCAVRRTLPAASRRTCRGRPPHDLTSSETPQIMTPKEEAMAASSDDISAWFDTGVREGAQYLIVVCDTFDYEDYPVYAKTPKEARDAYETYNEKNMQRVMEVYDLTAPKAPQMAERRAMHLPA
jgi:hypothetical protein